MGGGGRGEVSILSHRPVTSGDLKQDRLFFRESVSTFLQLVVAGVPLLPPPSRAPSPFPFPFKRLPRGLTTAALSIRAGSRPKPPAS